VKARDVILPFIILSVGNISFLIMWSVAAPMRWTRIDVANYDSFGRSVESYGTCSSGDGKTEKAIETAALVGIILVNLVALVVANYQCYKARNLPTDFNESLYITLSNASMLEALVLGGPILLVVGEDPSANFIVRSILVTIVCFTMLLPVFVPKYLQRCIRKKRRAAGYRARIVVSTMPSAPKRDSFARQGSEEIETNAPLKAGSSGIVRNNDYYFQRLTDTSSSAPRGGRTRQSFSTGSLMPGSTAVSTAVSIVPSISTSTLNHNFNNSCDFAEGLDNSNGSWRLSVPDPNSSGGPMFFRSMPQLPSRVSEEASGFCDQSSIENCSDHVAMKAGASQTKASEQSGEESNYES
jgi:hypothetical protein